MAKKILELFGYAPDNDTTAAIKSRNEQTCPRLAHTKLPFELRWVKNSPRATLCVLWCPRPSITRLTIDRPVIRYELDGIAVWNGIAPVSIDIRGERRCLSEKIAGVER